MKIGLIVLLGLLLAVVGVCGEVALFKECRAHGFSIFYCINKM